MSTLPVGLSRDLPAKRVMRATVGGQDLVVWRATNGEIAAWDNRCPHRGMALSHGFVRGNTLACLYHGWHYNGTGTCTYIPAHPDLEPPATIRTERFSVQEQGGVIWVSTDGEADAPTVPSDFEPLRAFIVAAPATQVQSISMQVPFDGQMADFEAAGVLQFGTSSIILLLNPMNDDRTQVTALARSGLTLAERRTLSRWCDAMRRLAEDQLEDAG